MDPTFNFTPPTVASSGFNFNAPQPVTPPPTPIQPFSFNPTPVDIQQPFKAGPQQQPTLDQAKQSIADIESSGGNYNAVGPKTKAGAQAYGKYQVMDFNIPTWTKEALGTSMTPQQFKADPAAQEKVFEHKFTEYAVKYGGYENAAKVWFGGPGALSNPNAKDVLGTSVKGYGDSFMSNIVGGLKTFAKRVNTGVDSAIADVPTNPKSFSNLGTPALEAGWQSLSNTIQDSGKRLSDSFSTFNDPSATNIAKGTSVGSAGVGIVNALFSPVSTFLATLSPIPVVGTVADTFNKVFAAIGGGLSGPAVGAVHDAAQQGFISQDTANTITPLVSELAGLTAQILVGHAGGEVAGGAIDAVARAAEVKRITQLNQDLVEHIKSAVDEAQKAPVKAPLNFEPPTTPVRQALLQNPEAPKLLGPGGDNPIQGEGFTMSDKTDAQKVAALKATNDFHAALDKFNQNATPKTLATVQKALAKMRDALEPEAVPVKAPKATPQPSARVINAAPIETVAPKVVEPVSTPETKAAPVEKPIVPDGQVINTRAETLLKAAVEKKLVENTGDVPTHEVRNMKEVSNSAVDFINKDSAEALKVAKGEAPAPDGLFHEDVYTALETKAIREKDVQLMRDLSKSEVPTKAGQRLKGLDSGDPNSPVKIMRDTQKAREAVVEKRTKQPVAKAKKAAVDEIKKEIKANVSKRPTWESFIKEVQCNY